MEKNNGSRASGLFVRLGSFIRRCMFNILSVGPIPRHIAFIMDGNRRYAKKNHMEEGSGHKAGFSALMSMLRYCYELRVKYVTIYAFSIENFKRRPEEVQSLMDLMLEKIEGLLKEESILDEYGIRVYFIGNLKLLNEPVRVAAEKVMRATARNTNCMLLICVAYTSCDEIVHAIQETCKEKWEKIQACSSHKDYNGAVEQLEDCDKKDSDFAPYLKISHKDEADGSQGMIASTACNGVAERVEGSKNENGVVLLPVECSSEDKCNDAQPSRIARIENGEIPVVQKDKLPGQCSSIQLVDIEEHMYMAVAPDPDILIRSSGETRLSNFLLWQTSNCPLYSPDALWPDVGLRHLVWAVLNFQRSHSYLEKKKKML